MKKLTLVAGVIYIVIKHRQYLAQKKKDYIDILATLPNCETCPLRKLNALVKVIVAESRIQDEAERSVASR